MRWYDKNEKLVKYLDNLKEMSPIKRDKILTEIMILIKQNKPDLLDKYVSEFPLHLYRRRWYDNDPYLWLLFNGLKFADKNLIKKVIELFEKSNKN